MLKTADNPPIIFPENSSIEAVERADQTQLEQKWWVAHTKSRNEKALAWNLLKWEIPYFLPLVEKISRCKGRKIKSLRPLFGGYIFFRGDEQDRYKALTTNRIAQIIPVVDQQKLVTELDQILRALRSEVTLDPHPYLKSGTRCRVVAGSLIGLEGTIIQKKSRMRLILNVEMLGQAAAIDIEADLLEPI